MNGDDEIVIAGRDGRAVSAPAGTARLLELGAVLAACRESFLETDHRFQWIPEPGSVAGKVADALPSPDPLLRTARAESVITEAVQTYMQIAAGHLGALGALYETGEVFVAPGHGRAGCLGVRRTGVLDSWRRQRRT